jgi:hypothetical protein
MVFCHEMSIKKCIKRIFSWTIDYFDMNNLLHLTFKELFCKHGRQKIKPLE